MIIKYVHTPGARSRPLSLSRARARSRSRSRLSHMRLPLARACAHPPTSPPRAARPHLTKVLNICALPVCCRHLPSCTPLLVAAVSFVLLRNAQPLTTQGTKSRRMRGARTGGAHDHSAGCPSSPLRPLVYVLFWLCGLLLLLVCFQKNTALSRGWCIPLARGSAVCEQTASHNTQILACFSDPLVSECLSGNIIKRNQTRPTTPGQIAALVAPPQHESENPHPRFDVPPESPLGGTMRFKSFIAPRAQEASEAKRA